MCCSSSGLRGLQHSLQRFRSQICGSGRCAQADRTSSDVYGPGIDNPIMVEEAGGTKHYLHRDGKGSIMAASASGGSVAFKFTADAWGFGADEEQILLANVTTTLARFFVPRYRL